MIPMTSFQVVPNEVTDAATRLAPISAGVSDVHDRLSACSGVGAGTPAEDAVAGLLDHWGSVLPQFAASAQSLTAAVGGAAEAYGATDANVAAGAVTTQAGPIESGQQ